VSQERFSMQHRSIGRAAIWIYLALSLVYAITTTLGLLSLESPLDPIRDPYFTMMELLIILIAPVMVVIMASIHAYASAETKVYSLSSLAFMVILAGITSSVHFIIITVRPQFEMAGITGEPLFLSFTWPSMAYAADILAWDVFFALSLIFAAPVFRGGGLEKTVRYLLLASGILSMLGLIGVPLANMNVRNIGVVGYALVAPVAFLFIALLFNRTKPQAE
jgi:hypothetical protein